MYSVLIQSQKTMQNFQRYNPLFQDAINQKEMGVCRWMEDGVSVDTALPELRNMIEGKKEWRAIIVSSMEDDDTVHTSFNPFDFEILQKEDKFYIRNPFIRLTHILGGVPVPELSFEREQIFEKNREPRMIYKPVYSENDEKEYCRLEEQYAYDGKRPVEILLVSMRKNEMRQLNVIQQAWNKGKIYERSNFWKKNKYPSNSRFLLFDIKNEGCIQKEADYFEFWICIRLLIMNKIDASVLQAYQLYKINAMIDSQKMSQSFQQSINALIVAERQILESIRRDEEKQLKIEKKMPDYKMKIPVILKTAAKDKIQIADKRFQVISKGEIHDLFKWNVEKVNAESEVNASIHLVERTLSETAERMRGFCAFSKAEVQHLDKYQEEDLSCELDDVFRQLLSLQNQLPGKEVSIEEGSTDAARNVREFLKKRIEKGQIIWSMMVFGMSFLIAVLPAIVECVLQNTGNMLGSFALMIVGIIVLLVGVGGALLEQHRKLGKCLDQYNSFLTKTMHQVTQSGDIYSDYLSAIVSYARGKNYLRLSRGKESVEENIYTTRRKHLKAISILREQIIRWEEAYYLKSDFSMVTSNEFYMDTDILPEKNRLYTLESEETFSIPLNRTGDTVYSPFEFVTNFKILQEDV